MSELNIKFKSCYLSGYINVIITIPNASDGMDTTAFYSSNRTYPVLWMLHGGYGTVADWFTYRKTPRYVAERDMIMVAPIAPNMDFSNQAEVFEGFYFEDFFIKELIPFVRNWFHGSPDSQENLIAGDSMGCAASYRYGLAYPQIFGHVGALCNEPLDYSYLEPYRNLTKQEFRELAKRERIATAYGIDSGVLHAKELNMICRYATVGDFLDSYENTLARLDDGAKNGTLPDIFVPGSIEKKWGAGMSNFRKHCEEKNIKNVTFDLYDMPTHNSKFWDHSVELFLEHAGFHKK
ncbi:MAG: esterase family protein [Bacteroides thetaiotaomicron]|nr:esterase family protein [Bacteroides thetaiotaomicron]